MVREGRGNGGFVGSSDIQASGLSVGFEHCLFLVGDLLWCHSVAVRFLTKRHC